MTESKKQKLKTIGIILIVVGVLACLIFVRSYVMERENYEEASLRLKYSKGVNVLYELSNIAECEGEMTRHMVCAVLSGGAGWSWQQTKKTRSYQATAKMRRPTHKTRKGAIYEVLSELWSRGK